MLTETTTFGIRMQKFQRRVLRREEKTLQTTYGSVRVKYGYDHTGRFIKSHIEFDDVKRVADEKGIPFRTALEAIRQELCFIQ
jgi:hypothetical protein